jgi:hypothetical protein
LLSLLPDVYILSPMSAVITEMPAAATCYCRCMAVSPLSSSGIVADVGCQLSLPAVGCLYFIADVGWLLSPRCRLLLLVLLLLSLLSITADVDAPRALLT